MVLPCSAAAIELDAICKSFPRQNEPAYPAITDFTLRILPGQVFGFFGPNGSGKTTLLKILCGIVPPTGGRLFVNGCDVLREPSWFRKQISALISGYEDIDSRRSVWENMLQSHANADGVAFDLPACAEIRLRELRLWDRRNETLALLSSGMRRQVSIASLIVSDAPIIVVDEPTLGLDGRAAETVGKWLKEWPRGKNRLVVLATSQANVLRQLCNQAVLMDQGRLVSRGSISDLFRPTIPESYELRIKGHLRQDWFDTSEGMTVVNENNGESTIRFAAQDQSALAGLLQRILGMGMSLVSLNRSEAMAEDL